MVTFFVGQRYRNRKGEYEVLQFQGDSMKVRYDDGSEQVLCETEISEADIFMASVLLKFRGSKQAQSFVREIQNRIEAECQK